MVLMRREWRTWWLRVGMGLELDGESVRGEVKIVTVPAS